ncbi:MAG: hypothetical protein M0036_07065 [Desulfobacteraceae bacterium]|nr:hypothetical protein [Desulfobacteraceae bacterium]
MTTATHFIGPIGANPSKHVKPHLQSNDDPHLRSLKMKQRRTKKVATTRKQKKFKNVQPKKESVTVAKTVSQTLMEISPATALLLLLFEE